MWNELYFCKQLGIPVTYKKSFAGLKHTHELRKKRRKDRDIGREKGKSEGSKEGQTGMKEGT